MKVLCVGLMVCDILVMPVSSELFTMDHTMIDTLELSVGGDAFNVASNLHALGVETCLVSSVGRDHLGRFVEETMAEMGMETSGIAKSDRPTSATVVMISPDGERHFAAKRGASQYLCCDDVPDDFLAEYDLLYIGSSCGLDGLDGEDMQRLVDRARSHGMKVAMDVTGKPLRKHMDWLGSVLQKTDYFFPSDYEAKALTGASTAADAARAFLDCGVKHVIVKCGMDGAIYIEPNGEVHHFPAEDVPVVDTTGAGDAFAAGFLASITKGYDMKRSIEIATRAASACIQEVGASGKLKAFANYETVK